jgi:type II secretory pathway pseudopilin PulG
VEADESDVGPRLVIAAALRRIRDERGVTLPELIGVLAILLIVLTPLVSSFTTALRHEADQSQREAAYSSARLALQRMRTDLHCASGVTAVNQNAYGGFTLTLTQANDVSAGGWCPTVIPQGSGSSGVQWCTIPYSGSTTRYRLYRFLGLNPTDCDGGTGSTFQIDYIAPPTSGWPTNTTVTPTPTGWEGNLWPDPEACPTDRLPTLTVRLNTSVDPDGSPYRHYEIVDAIALRNAERCL